MNIDEELNNIYENLDLKMEEIGILDKMIEEESNVSSKAIDTEREGNFHKNLSFKKRWLFGGKKESLDINSIKNSRKDLNIFVYDFDADISLLKKDLLLCYNNEEDLESLNGKISIKVSSDNENELNNNPLKEHKINKKSKSKNNEKI